ncbi:hypothetical protein Tco_0607004 [Tanacetum coccineum]
MAAEVPQTLEYRGDQLNAAPVLEVENFTNWKKRKPEGQWTADERKAANLDQRLKSLIMSVLPDDQMNSVINCLTAKSTWDDLILYHEGPSNVKKNIIYETEKSKSLGSATPLSTDFFSTFIVHDFQDSPDDEEDTRSSHEYLNDLEEEYQARALLAKSKSFFKKDEEEVSFDDNEVRDVKALMALADEERVSISKESARNGEWIKISIKKYTLFLK